MHVHLDKPGLPSASSVVSHDLEEKAEHVVMNPKSQWFAPSKIKPFEIETIGSKGEGAFARTAARIGASETERFLGTEVGESLAESAARRYVVSAVLTNPEIYTEPGAMMDMFAQQAQEGIMELYGYQKTAHPKKGDGIYTERVDHVTIGALMYGLDKKMKDAKDAKDFVKNVLLPQINSLQISQKIAGNRMGFVDKYGKGLMIPQDAANFYIDRNFEMKTPTTIGELVVELQKLEKLSDNPKDSFLYRNEVQENFLANKLITRFLIKYIDNKGGGDEVAKAVHKLRFSKRGWSYPWQDSSDDGNKLNLKSMNKDWKEWSEKVGKEADHVQAMLLQRKLPDPDTIASNNQSKPSWWEGHQLQLGRHWDPKGKVWVNRDGTRVVPVDKDGKPILPKPKVDFDKIKKQGFGKEPSKMVKKQTTKHVPQSAEEFLKQNPDMDPRVAAKKQAEKDAYVAHFQGKDAAEVIARREAAAKKKAEEDAKAPIPKQEAAKNKKVADDHLDKWAPKNQGVKVDYDRWLEREKGKAPAQREADWKDFKHEMFKRYDLVWDEADFRFIDKMKVADKHDDAAAKKLWDKMQKKSAEKPRADAEDPYVQAEKDEKAAFEKYKHKMDVERGLVFDDDKMKFVKKPVPVVPVPPAPVVPVPPAPVVHHPVVHQPIPPHDKKQNHIMPPSVPTPVHKKPATHVAVSKPAPVVTPSGPVSIPVGEKKNPAVWGGPYGYGARVFHELHIADDRAPHHLPANVAIHVQTNIPQHLAQGAVPVPPGPAKP